MLSTNGMVSLELVAQDGTKVRAQAGADTFRRQRTLEEETAKAEAMMDAIERAGFHPRSRKLDGRVSPGWDVPHGFVTADAEKPGQRSMPPAGKQRSHYEPHRGRLVRKAKPMMGARQAKD